MTFAERCREISGDTRRAPSERLHDLFEATWANDMAEFPERATSTGFPGHDGELTSWSPDAVARRRREAGLPLAALESIDRGALGEVDQVSYDLFRREHQLRVEATQFPSEYLSLSNLGGPHTSVGSTLANTRATTRSQTEDVLSRLRRFPTLLAELVELLREGVDRGITTPRVTLDGVADQFERMAASPPDENPLLVPLQSGAGREGRNDGERILASEIVPALRATAAFVRDTYVPAARSTIAITALPDGEAWYAHAIRRFTTTNLGAQEIHDIGQSEVKRLRAEMDTIIDSTGHAGDFASFCDFLRTDRQFYFDDAEALLASYRDIAKRVDPELIRLFGRLPRLPYGVTPVPDHEAPTTTTAYYMRGSLPAGRPGWFYANTYDLSSRPKWEMEALTLHEAVPGHHLQIALAAEIEGLPAFRRMGLGYTAYVEGWGLYAESLGDEMGFYRDPYAKFGQLTYEMWRAIRLVVDTGMHAFGWSRDQAITFFRENAGKADHDIAVEVDRYIAWPGQALAYKLGELKLKELRDHAATELGDAFDIRSFHDEVLGAGALPLDVLDERIRAWVRASGAQAGAR